MNTKTETTKKRPTLDDVMAYQNARVISSFVKSFGVAKEDAADIFEQLKRMLWLVNEMEYDDLRAQQKMFSIDTSLLVIDEMWHIFILFTKEYREFCDTYFGYFIDHFPAVKDENDLAQAKRTAELAALSHEGRISKVMDEKRWQYRYVFEKLGREYFLKWYTVYHDKYTPKVLAELRLNTVTGSNSDLANN